MSDERRAMRLGLMGLSAEERVKANMDAIGKIEDLDTKLRADLEERLKNKNVAVLVTDVGSDAISMDSVVKAEKVSSLNIEGRSPASPATNSSVTDGVLIGLELVMLDGIEGVANAQGLPDLSPSVDNDSNIANNQESSIGSDTYMDAVSFTEKRTLQKTIQDKNAILSVTPSFAEKRAAQKVKQEALSQLGLSVAPQEEEQAEPEETGFVKSPHGSYSFGEITADQATAISKPSGQIRLLEGQWDEEESIGTGLEKLKSLRESEVKRSGLLSVEKFIQYVVNNVDEIRDIPSSKDILLVSKQDDNVLLVTLSRGGQYYLVEDIEVPLLGMGRREKWPLLWTKPTDEPQAPVEEEQAAIEPKEETELSDDDDLNPNSPNYRYKDTGNIAGSRKELAASEIRNAGKSGLRLRKNDIDWDEIEVNPRLAKELITKSNLFGQVDWEGLKTKGMEPGAGFLIDRIYAAVGKEPDEDNTLARKDYALGLETLRDRLESCHTPDQVTKVIDEMADEMMGVNLNEQETEEYAKLREQANELYSGFVTYREEDDRLYKVYNSYQSKASSAEWEQEKRIRRKWKPDPELTRIAEENKKLAEQANKEWMAFRSANTYYDDKLKVEANGNFHYEGEYRKARNEVSAQLNAIVEGAKRRNVLENPLNRAWLRMGEKFGKVLFYRKGAGSDAFRGHVATAKAGKIKDWSWAEKTTTTKTPRSTQESQRFQLKVADRYERVGGRKIAVDSTAGLKEHFGLREVQSGNWVLRDVNSAKFHTEQTANALADLADIMGVDDKTLSMGGKLAIAFGSRGTGNAGFGGAARAHYEPVERVVNLTKMGGGGCLCHELLHCFDNLLSEALTGKPSTSDTWLTEGAEIPDGALKNAFTELKSVIRTGEVPLPIAVKYTDKDYKTAVYNIDRQFSNPNSLQLKIKDAGSAEAAVKLLIDRWGDDVINNKKNRNYDWVKIAVAWYDKNQYGNQVFLPLGRKTSSFEREAVRLDGGVPLKYWSQPKEMAARAFQSYCEDRLAEQGRRNDYLSVYADNKYYNDPIFGQSYPFPDGEERKAINAVFDKVVAAMREGKAFDAIAAIL